MMSPETDEALCNRLDEIGKCPDPKLDKSWLDAFERGDVVMVAVDCMEYLLFLPNTTKWSFILECIEEGFQFPNMPKKRKRKKKGNQ